MKKYTLGVDVGGTNIKLGIVNQSGRIVARSRLVTKSYVKHSRLLIDALIHEIESLLAKSRFSRKHIAGIGIGLPGLVDVERGKVVFLPNIPGWRHVALKGLVQRRLRIPTFIENDVNMVTLGEWKFGAGKGYKNLICMTLGTGVGGGLVMNGALYRGEGFVAGEIGHVPLNEAGPRCNCGGEACFERYVGNRYLQAKAAKMFGRSDIRLEDVFALAVHGNVKARRFWKETAEHIGHALVGVINLLNPRVVIIGGGVANNLKFMQKGIKSVIQKRGMPIQKKMARVVRAKLGDDAGIIGAHVLVKEMILAR